MFLLASAPLAIDRLGSADTGRGGIVQPACHQYAPGPVDCANGAWAANAATQLDLAAELDLANAAGHAKAAGHADVDGLLAYAPGKWSTAAPAPASADSRTFLDLQI